MAAIKNALRKVTPLRASTFGDVKDVLIERLDEIIASGKANAEQLKRATAQLGRVDTAQSDMARRLERMEAQLSAVDARLRSTEAEVKAARFNAYRAYTASSEVVYAESFRSATAGCSWLQDVPFSPGRWAVGYQYLYVLFHVLHDTHPTSILDLGLGQSSNLIARYASSCDGVRHDVIEHDATWIAFFEHEQGVPESMNIINLDLALVEREGCEKPVRVYQGFGEAVAGKRYNLISIDAPFGGDMNEVARVDVLDQLPDILADSFVIMLDDYNREGERHTAELMGKVLDAAGIAHVDGMYQGEKRTFVICSQDLSFIATL